MVQQQGTLVERMLEAFMGAHRGEWAKHTFECYQSVLEAFYQEFHGIPGNPIEVIRWLQQLEPLRQSEPLKPGTRQDYYERIRYLYRWAKDNVADAQDLPELPYESFASRLRRS